MSANTESPGARILAGSLRRAREAAGLSLRALAKRLKISHSVISYWETAQRIPTPEDVASFLTAVGVTGQERAHIIQLAKDASASNYLAVGVDGVTKQLYGIMECERSASYITNWSPMLIPGLLQTAEYARAIIQYGKKSRHQEDATVALRAGRLNKIFDRPRPALLDVLIGESALRRKIGDTETMARQVQSLIRAANRSEINIRVMPEQSGWHAGLLGPLVFYQFPGASPIVYLEHHRSGAFLYNDHDIAEYRSAIDDMRELIMDVTDSAAFMSEIAEKWRAQHGSGPALA